MSDGTGKLAGALIRGISEKLLVDALAYMKANPFTTESVRDLRRYLYEKAAAILHYAEAPKAIEREVTMIAEAASSYAYADVLTLTLLRAKEDTGDLDIVKAAKRTAEGPRT